MILGLKKNENKKNENREQRHFFCVKHNVFCIKMILKDDTLKIMCPLNRTNKFIRNFNEQICSILANRFVSQ